MSEAFKTGRKPRPKKDKWTSLLEDNLTSISRVKRDRIFASNAGLCARQTAAYRFLPGTHVEKRKAVTQFYFKVGSAMERVVLGGFKQAGVLLDAECRVESPQEDVPVSGRIDFVVRDPEDENEIVLIELKSCGKLPTKPRHAHLAQLQVYLLLTGMPKGLVWYISRDIASYPGPIIKQQIFPVTPTWEDRTNTARILAEGAIFGNEGVLPPRPEYMKKSYCGFCPFIPNCWGGVTEGIPLEYRPASAKEREALLKKSDKAAGELLTLTPYLKEEFHRVMLED